MLVMTAMVVKKKLIIAAAAAVLLIVAIVIICCSAGSSATSGSLDVTSNDDRIRFLTSYGWEVATSPVESGQVLIPSEASQVFSRYNDLQQTMGYDLTDFSGKTVMRYVYQIKNYPGATEEVYATLLICNNQVIGGDITDTSVNGKIQGFGKASA